MTPNEVADNKAVTRSPIGKLYLVGQKGEAATQLPQPLAPDPSPCASPDLYPAHKGFSTWPVELPPESPAVHSVLQRADHGGCSSSIPKRTPEDALVVDACLKVAALRRPLARVKVFLFATSFTPGRGQPAARWRSGRSTRRTPPMQAPQPACLRSRLPRSLLSRCIKRTRALRR